MLMQTSIVVLQATLGAFIVGMELYTIVAVGS